MNGERVRERSEPTVPFINSSISHDQYIPSYRLSNDTDLRVNYAPLDKQLHDTLVKRNVHPLARYLDNVPLYEDFFPGMKPALQVVQAESRHRAKQPQEPRVRLTDPKWSPNSVQTTKINTNMAVPTTTTKYGSSKSSVIEAAYPEIDRFNILTASPLADEQRMRANVERQIMNRSGIVKEMTESRRRISEPTASYAATNSLLSHYEPVPLTNYEKSVVNGSKPKMITTETFIRMDQVRPETNLRMDQTPETFITPKIIEVKPQRQLLAHHPGYEKTLYPKTKTLNVGEVSFNALPSRESYSRIDGDTYMDQVYIQSLESRMKAVCHYINNNRLYDYWNDGWKHMTKVLEDSNFSFSRLETSDADIAFTINKGELTKFRIRGNDMHYIPLNICQYVLYHEMAHIANYKEWGHGTSFCMYLSLLCLAAFEIGLIDIRRISEKVFTTDKKPILCQADMKSEISRGIDYMIKAHPDMKKHYEELRDYIMAR